MIPDWKERLEHKPMEDVGGQLLVAFAKLAWWMLVWIPLSWVVFTTWRGWLS
jgi:hypothetical protein